MITRMLTGVVAAAVVSATAAGPAQAAPLPVSQIPMTATQLSGMLVPQTFHSKVVADSTGRPGQSRLSVWSSIRPSAYDSMVRIDYRNLGTGKRGSVTVKPADWNVPYPQIATVDPGVGRIAFTARWVNVPPAVVTVKASTPGTGFITLR
ncbi:hypothetical protein P0W64_14500 [Tsukamurella sp. 8F]|uniref:hypothetical protein n=1 Tax=unclassified Tsukamurella TaxID=2633480 RepID=UPI0023B98A21|nr:MULTISPECIES: hypothetical protein [unclassified Tsukamurella]MDF0531962.1 hypothetical protein [Tsukamurella sp. 8J]MDF0587987.1 hypothetical protein [Tsukamurella sp. 8F]